MTNNQKRRGNQWERDATKLLNAKYKDTWKRIALSGAIGTNLNIPIMSADMVGKYPFLQKGFVAEAKTGYGEKQMALKQEWFDRIEEIGKSTYSYPLLVGKFNSTSRTSVKHFICMSFDTWHELLEQIHFLHNLAMRNVEGKEG